MLKIVVGVVFARWHDASAGHVCSIMHWALGFRELGCEVWIVDAISSAELSPPAADGLASPQEEFWRAIVEEFDFHGRECFLIDGQSTSLEAFREFASGADLFVNYSGQFKRSICFGARTVKAYLDVDPAFTQLWVEVFGSDMNLDGHDVFLTVGTTMNSPEALVPKLGREWIPVFPPVVATFWRQKLGTFPDESRGSAWTTVAHWYGYNDLEWKGRRYAGKRESLMSMRVLPQHLEKPCVIATDLAPGWDDYTAFRRRAGNSSRRLRSASLSHRICGLSRRVAVRLASPRRATSSRGGWMSDRSVVYLALGRPVVFQDTGWTEAMAPADGMLIFHDVDDCARAISSIEDDYDTHSRAAQSLADTIFSPQQVLRPLLEKIL